MRSPHTVTDLLDFEQQHNLNTGQLYTLAKSLSTTISEVMKEEKERATIQANYIDALSGFDDDIGAIVRHTIKQLRSDLINNLPIRINKENVIESIRKNLHNIERQINQSEKSTDTLIENLEKFSQQNNIPMPTTQAIIDTFSHDPYETINKLVEQIDTNELLDAAIYSQSATENKIGSYRDLHIYEKIIANKEKSIQQIQSYTGNNLIKLSAFLMSISDVVDYDIIEALIQQSGGGNHNSLNEDITSIMMFDKKIKEYLKQGDSPDYNSSLGGLIEKSQKNIQEYALQHIDKQVSHIGPSDSITSISSSLIEIMNTIELIIDWEKINKRRNYSNQIRSWFQQIFDIINNILPQLIANQHQLDRSINLTKRIEAGLEAFDNFFKLEVVQHLILMRTKLPKKIEKLNHHKIFTTMTGLLTHHRSNELMNKSQQGLTVMPDHQTAKDLCKKLYDIVNSNTIKFKQRS